MSEVCVGPSSSTTTDRRAMSPRLPLSLKELTTVVLTRPIRMIVLEPIVNTSCVYLALCYAIFYMSFEAFPIIFQGLYGLTYLAIGAGCLLALPVFWAYDNILYRARERDAPWTRQEESHRLPLACIVGPLFAISLFWLGWTARQPVPFFVPMLAGVPFGMGFMCIFQALLPHVRPLGIAGACSLLDGVSLLMCGILFLSLWQGERIRTNSKFCIARRRRRREEMARKIEGQRARRKTRLS
ncbi:hypothetical protein B0T25DRAFT_616029 [Lasiosphaeria hispida]|uniref:Uncharacterized protein n=1 Tax=Lasiosphaeria hispida TaxID=260671 RepID=A0AAJ0HA72_9PEZI|nr:hypothetical protein B0T25DRAFT_616029 [Lasiosphaeria hispida]